MDKVQIIALVAALLLLIQVIFLASKNKLHNEHAFMWLLFALLGILIAILLPSFNRMAEIMGVDYMPTLVFTFAFLVVLSLLMYHTISFSHQQEKIKTLVQEVAFLTKELEGIKTDKEKGEVR